MKDENILFLGDKLMVFNFFYGSTSPTDFSFNIVNVENVNKKSPKVREAKIQFFMDKNKTPLTQLSAFLALIWPLVETKRM